MGRYDAWGGVSPEEEKVADEYDHWLENEGTEIWMLETLKGLKTKTQKPFSEWVETDSESVFDNWREAQLDDFDDWRIQ